MPILTPQERLEKLKAEKAKIEQRIKKEAGRLSAQKRKRDNRRKYIAGGALLAAIKEGDKEARLLLNRLVTDESDRKELFEFLPKS